MITRARKTNAGRGAGWLQLATYPQSPFSGPAHCCDVTDLYQAFSQRTGPGRLWISLGAILQQPTSAPEKQLTTVQPFRRSVIHLSAMYPNRCQRSFRSKQGRPPSLFRVKSGRYSPDFRDSVLRELTWIEEIRAAHRNDMHYVLDAALVAQSLHH